ncbi:MAG: excinuclease ABC subunit C [SAR202 cluster bacterium Io17-Chloro-G4]|nr:MAG: excinuclease ABC subunit C [SAR202 cluster bacterium Io17-Chloro-G4]
MALPLIEQRLRLTPERPGVYMMRDARDTVLYVGKASVLRNRVRTYFGSPTGQIPKIRRMMGQVHDFEYIVTDSEAEALILENTLIKRYRPRYNARLKDDKTYPFLKIDLNEEFPRVTITRKVFKDGARYFGPFATAGSVRKTMDLVKRLFPYRSCTKKITGTDPRPCLEYYINRCVAPCSGYAGPDEYAKVIQQVVLFMEGDTDTVTDDLRANMEKAAENLEFERAAVLRDRIRSVEKVADEQRITVDSNPIKDMDVMALQQGTNESWIEVFFVRHNKLIGRDHFFMEGTQDDSPELVLSQFIKQFYSDGPVVPPNILVQHPLEDSELINDWLRDVRGGAVRLLRPQRGVHKKLMDVVAENATQGLAQHQIKWLNNVDALGQAMSELEEELSLPASPFRMECYDISHIQGTNTVASMVVFEDGMPKTANYRRFKVKTVEGVDDFESMREVLRRRFKRLAQNRAAENRASQTRALGQEDGSDSGPDSGPDSKEGEGDTWGILPDLVLIDGGKGQLSAALEVLLELGMDDIPLASLAKENEWLYVPQTQEPIILPKDSQALYLVQRMRDEAHRFAITYHRNLRSKSSLRSPIDGVTGIGPKRKRMLMRRFGTLQGIKQATVDDIASVPGMTRSLAMRLKQTI